MVLVDFVLQIVQNHWDKNISSAVVSSTLDIYRQILYLFIILFVYFIFMFYYFADYLFPVSCGCPRQYHNVWHYLVQIHIKEYRRGNQNWTIQRNWQKTLDTQDEEKQNKNTTHYV
jgi:hypothetical protein